MAVARSRSVVVVALVVGPDESPRVEDGLDPLVVGEGSVPLVVAGIEVVVVAGVEPLGTVVVVVGATVVVAGTVVVVVVGAAEVGVAVEVVVEVVADEVGLGTAVVVVVAEVVLAPEPGGVDTGTTAHS